MAGITSQVELNKVEEKISKQKEKMLFDSGKIDKIKVSTFAGIAGRQEPLAMTKKVGSQ